eukprot:jgi/Tetstr1/425331/TSEL_015780.t1
MASHPCYRATATCLLFLVVCSFAVSAQGELDHDVPHQDEYFGQYILPTKGLFEAKWMLDDKMQDINKAIAPDDDVMDELDERLMWQFLQRQETPASVIKLSNHGAMFGGLADVFGQDPLSTWIDHQIPVFSEVFGSGMSPFGSARVTVWRQLGNQEEPEEEYDEEEDTVRCLGALSRLRFLSDMHSVSVPLEIRDPGWQAFTSGDAEAAILNSEPAYLAVDEAPHSDKRSTAWIIAAAGILAAIATAGGCYCCVHCSCVDGGQQPGRICSASQPLLSFIAAPKSPPKSPVKVAPDHDRYADIPYTPLKEEQ